uniref:Uncharacterized protein LOC104220318 isoform X2 n=1 Tax=Nicotiana sylvestris TaxID=4096 RepID=A0A1U7VSY2_NICSY|nr:PREDICTED: uncharacterized protein LOC104220318 isoform X2 [Nicotiana sylvestris]
MDIHKISVNRELRTTIQIHVIITNIPGTTKGKCIAANVVTGVQGMPSDMTTTKGEDLEHQGSHRNQNVNLSKEQYEQVVRLLQHFQSDGAGDNSNSTNIINGAVNFAGKEAYIT